MEKPIDDMSLDVKFNMNGTFVIFTTDTELSKEDVPDLLVDPSSF
jgi:hypothetical protein